MSDADLPPRSEEHDATRILKEHLATHAIEDEAAFERLLAAHPERALDLMALRRIRQMDRPVNDRDPGFDAADSKLPIPTRELLAKIRDTADPLARLEDPTPLGEGGMGVVLKMRDTVFKRFVAVKTLKDRVKQGNSAPRAHFVNRFLEEAQITSQLNHSGVVPVHHVGIDPSGWPCFVMRYVDGDDLARIFDRMKLGDPEWSRTRALGILLRVCETVAYAHSKNVIHRDLKPANIRIGRYGETFVMDWGLARTLETESASGVSSRKARPATHIVHTDLREKDSNATPLFTLDGQAIGTVYYMSPEQAQGENDHIGKPSDIYSVGAVLYELLSGDPPYSTEDPTAKVSELVRRIASEAPSPLRGLAPDAPPELIAIAEKAMARRPRDRYPTMDEFAADLRAYLENRVVRAYRSGALAELVMWVRRNRLAASLVAATLLIGAGAGFVVSAISKRELKDKQLQVLVAEANRLVRDYSSLGPIHPDEVGRFETWISRADALKQAAQEFGQVADRERLEEATEIVGEEDGSRVAATVNRWAESRTNWTKRKISELEERVRGSASHLEEVRLAAAQRELGMRQSRAKQDALWSATRVGQEMAHADAGRVSVARLRASLNLLFDPTHGLVREATERRTWAGSLEHDTLRVHRDQWEAAIAVIRDQTISPDYFGFRLEPQLGLIPLGRNPASGLYEFWVLHSGDRPDWVAGTVLNPESCGIVLVLIPGFSLRSNWCTGSGPFFFGKFEVTYEQLNRAGLENLSQLKPGDWMRNLNNYWDASPVTNAHPATYVSWYESTQVLEKLKLSLPPMACYEAVAAFRTPERKLSMDVTQLPICFGNFAIGGVDDGFREMAGVGQFAPIACGVYDLHGNAAEWCSDWLLQTPSGKLAADSWRRWDGDALAEDKAIFNFSYLNDPTDQDHSLLLNRPPHYKSEFLGFRAYRAVELHSRE